MPWTARDASRHTHAAKSPRQKRAWAEIATKSLASGKSEASAIRIANAAVHHLKPTLTHT